MDLTFLSGRLGILDSPHIELGDGAKINEQVFVGGMEFPESKFILGKNTIVMQLTYINTARPVIIGDDSGIGGHCILFTHGSWLSKFEGYPVQFAPIHIGKSVWLPWRIFIMPGTKIGDGSVIGANSMVSGTIPPRSLAVGSPAKVIRRSPEFPAAVTETERNEIFYEILREMVKYFEFYDIRCQTDGEDFVITSVTKGLLGLREKRMRMRVRSTISAEGSNIKTDGRLDLVLSLPMLDDGVRRLLTSRSVSWIDLDNKERSVLTNDLTDEVGLFLTRYGVRLTRVG